MIKSIFKFVCLIIMLLIIYNVFGYVFQLKLETFTIGYQNNEEEDDEEEEDEGEEKEEEKEDEEEKEENIKSQFNTEMIQNRENTIMDLRDLYSNLCPLDYNINMIKMNNNVTRVNQYPGYVEDVFIDLTRQIKSDEPLPTTADFFK